MEFIRRSVQQSECFLHFSTDSYPIRAILITKSGNTGNDSPISTLVGDFLGSALYLLANGIPVAVLRFVDDRLELKLYFAM